VNVDLRRASLIGHWDVHLLLLRVLGLVVGLAGVLNLALLILVEFSCT
jgi:hypothetical protein